MHTLCVCSGLWWYAEREMGGAFDSIPTSMMYTLFFLLGEWVTPDFETYTGIFLCYFQCFLGLIFFGILVGALSDLMSDILEHYVKFRDSLDFSHGRQYYLDKEKMARHILCKNIPTP